MKCDIVCGRNDFARGTQVPTAELPLRLDGDIALIRHMRVHVGGRPSRTAAAAPHAKLNLV
jgi:hypothetical protein